MVEQQDLKVVTQWQAKTLEDSFASEEKGTNIPLFSHYTGPLP